MPKRLVFVHTIHTLIPPFSELAAQVLGPGVEAWHIADELLLRVVLEAGGLTPLAYRRVAEHVVAAEQAGASAIQLTCSSISPCADSARPLVSIPVLKVDEPMVERAVALGARIGVLATVRTTLGPTTDLVTAHARQLGKQITLDARLCEQAYPALLAGDLERHDRLVREALGDLMAHNDVVLLAQASMARVADALAAEERRVPVLSSPRLALERAKEVLQGRS